MNFYRLEQSVVQKIVGKYPPFETGYFPVDANDPRLIINIYFEKVSENEVYVPIPKLRKGANLIDFMDGPGGHAIISDKLKQIILQTNPIGLQFLQQKIIKENIELEGYWLTNNYEFDYNVFDFDRTEISIMKSTWDVEYTIRIKNTEEFLLLKEEVTYPKRIKIFRPYFSENYTKDFFALRHVYSGFSFFCSERFRQKLEDQKITGIRFMELGEVL